MSILFLSHSSKENDAAVKVRDWLRSQGYNEIFLDLDPNQGLAAGHRWQEELKRAGERCSAVIVLVSGNWAASVWCRTEFLLAVQLGKRIFPILIAPTAFDDLPRELVAHFQIADISEPMREAEGFANIAIGLKRAGLSPTDFPWPPEREPGRAPYRGLVALKEEDAAIFFGRDGVITRGLDALRRMRGGATERLLIVLGASGAGKSSFLRAGLIPRLKRDEVNFAPLPVIRPGSAALSGPDGLDATLGRPVRTAAALVATFDEARAAIVERFRRYATVGHEQFLPPEPTVVLAIDQAEELFDAENAEGLEALTLIGEAIAADPNAVAILTIRSDRYELLQNAPQLADLRPQLFDLPAMTPSAFKAVIEGPAKLAGLAIEPVLTDKLLADLEDKDALPLLAFTLERLFSHHIGGRLTLKDYNEGLRGLSGAIQSAVDAAFSSARNDPALPNTISELLALARGVFLSMLVSLDNVAGKPRRRLAPWSEIAPASRPLIAHLIDQRILVSDRPHGVGKTMVEVAHEAILRHWPDLAEWIEGARENLVRLDGLRRAAVEWQLTSCERDLLVHRGDRLIEAEALLNEPGLSPAVGEIPKLYLAECRAAQNRDQWRRRVLLGTIAGLLLVVGIVVAGGFFTVTRVAAVMDQRQSDTLAAMSEQAADRGAYDSAMRLALAGAGRAESGPLTRFNSSAAMRALERAVMSTPSVAPAGILPAWRPEFSSNGRFVVSWKGRVAIATEVLGWKSICRLVSAGGPIDFATISSSGRWVFLSEREDVAVFDCHSGKLQWSRRVPSHSEPAFTYAQFGGGGSFLIVHDLGEAVSLYDTGSGGSLGRISYGGGRFVEEIDSTGHFALVSDTPTRQENDEKKSIVRVQDGATIASLPECVNKFRCMAKPDFSVLAEIDQNAVSFHSLSPMSGKFAKISADQRVDEAVFDDAWNRVAIFSSINNDRTQAVVQVWDTRSGKRLGSSFEIRGERAGVQFTPEEGVLIIENGDALQFFNYLDGVAQTPFATPGQIFFNTVHLLDGNRIVFITNDRQLQYVHVVRADVFARVGRVLRCAGRNDAIFAKFSPLGKYLFTGCMFSGGTIWDWRTGTPVHVFERAVESIDARWSADERRLAVATGDFMGADAVVDIWNTTNWTRIGMMRIGVRNLNQIALSSDGSKLALALGDPVWESHRDHGYKPLANLEMWDVSSEFHLLFRAGVGEAVEAVDLSPDGTRLAAGSYGNGVRLLNAGTGAQIAGPLPLDWPNLAFTAGGERLAMGDGDGRIMMLDGHSLGTVGVAFAGGEGLLPRMNISADGSRAVVASDHYATLWDTATGARIGRDFRYGGLNGKPAFSPDGRLLAAPDDGGVQVWDISRIAYLIRGYEAVKRACYLLGREAKLTPEELTAAPFLDPVRDFAEEGNVCKPRGPLVRLFGTR